MKTKTKEKTPVPRRVCAGESQKISWVSIGAMPQFSSQAPGRPPGPQALRLSGSQATLIRLQPAHSLFAVPALFWKRRAMRFAGMYRGKFQQKSTPFTALFSLTFPIQAPFRLLYIHSLRRANVVFTLKLQCRVVT
ncbi:predicted protein [Histoplasma capsulatum G186AR]|uniref:Uncharacterized protein n=1 Tax=Ajellomyces capsulatus (strain G186AR / H82 / ATCC MYA-2454 / RMSCC 2432) TaxID=447093 RepID=C0NQN0_AJECG|nr:uncharacterized protein HCBG_05310 [Histoplasma capsulatum G186AR]EEH05994.1 predicted protein [Histoplasma capsulatum G186AR]